MFLPLFKEPKYIASCISFEDNPSFASFIFHALKSLRFNVKNSLAYFSINKLLESCLFALFLAPFKSFHFGGSNSLATVFFGLPTTPVLAGGSNSSRALFTRLPISFAAFLTPWSICGVTSSSCLTIACMPSMAESGSRRSYFQLVEISCKVSLKLLIIAFTSLAACLPKSCQFILRKY